MQIRHFATHVIGDPNVQDGMCLVKGDPLCDIIEENRKRIKDGRPLRTYKEDCEYLSRDENRARTLESCPNGQGHYISPMSSNGLEVKAVQDLQKIAKRENKEFNFKASYSYEVFLDLKKKGPKIPVCDTAHTYLHAKRASELGTEGDFRAIVTRLQNIEFACL